MCFAISSHCSTSDKIVAGLFLVVACILVCHQRLSVHCWLACLLILSFLTRSKCFRFRSIATLPRWPSEKARPRTIATLPRPVARTNRRGYPSHILDTSTVTLPRTVARTNCHGSTTQSFTSPTARPGSSCVIAVPLSFVLIGGYPYNVGGFRFLLVFGDLA